MRYSRKPRDVEAMQLTMGNLQEVSTWSKGKLKATQQQYPPIRIDSATKSAYAMPSWWLVLQDNGDFELLHNIHFKSDYEEQVEREPCEGSDA